MKEIRNIRKAKVNGINVKLFEVWEKVGNAWIFAGQYKAPARVANKNLLEVVR